MTALKILQALPLTSLLALSACGGGEPEQDPQQRTEDGIPVQSKWKEEPGRWRKARGAQELTDEQRAVIEELAAIGYAAGTTEAGAFTGVTRHDPERAWNGLNFSTSGHAPEAFLTDMRGQVLHRWSFGFQEAFPESAELLERGVTDFWRRAVLLENGDVLAIFEGLGLIKLDKDSRLIWKSPIRAHHELAVLPDGRIWVLTRTPRLIPRFNPNVPILEDSVAELGPDGDLRWEVSVLECMENSPFFPSLEKRIKKGKDVFHTNTLKVLDGSLADRVPAFQAGNVLVSMRHVSVIAVLDLEAGRCLWAQNGDYARQHDSRVLKNGHLLLFDNNEREKGSSVQELDPATGEVLWSYRGTAEDPFFSNSCGTAQRLPNGNTLITETDNGRAIEVTEGGEIVWEFYNPTRAGADDEYIASLFEVVRLPQGFGDDWLQGD